MVKNKSFLICVFAFCVACSALAQRRLSLEECVALAEKNNFNIKIAEASAERAVAMKGTAWDVGRTELSLSQDPTSGGSPDNAISLSQQMEFPTVYMARRRQLKAEAVAESKRRDVVLADLRADIASAYYQILYCQEQRALLLAQDSVLKCYVEVAETRYKAGEARQIEWLSAKRMLRENGLLVTAADDELAVAAMRLKSLVGSDFEVTPSSVGLEPIAFDSCLTYDYGSSAQGTWAHARLKALDCAVASARSEFAPSLTVALRNQLVISGWNPYNENRARYAGGNFMGFEVGIGIPLFYGATRAKLKAARKERDIARLEMSREADNLQRNRNVAMTRLMSAKRRLDYYNGTGLSCTEDMARLGRLEYENGEIDYVEYMNVLQQWTDAQLKRATAINDYNQAVVEMRRGMWQNAQ